MNRFHHLKVLCFTSLFPFLQHTFWSLHCKYPNVFSIHANPSKCQKNNCRRFVMEKRCSRAPFIYPPYIYPLYIYNSMEKSLKKLFQIFRWFIRFDIRLDRYYRIPFRWQPGRCFVSENCEQPMASCKYTSPTEPWVPGVWPKIHTTRQHEGTL